MQNTLKELGEKHARERDEIEKSLKRLGVPAEPGLMEWASDPNGEVRLGVAVALQVQMVANAEPLLTKLLKDDDADVRSQAAIAAGVMGPDAVVNALLEMCHNKDPQVRCSAVQVLGRRRLAVLRLSKPWSMRLKTHTFHPATRRFWGGGSSLEPRWTPWRRSEHRPSSH